MPSLKKLFPKKIGDVSSAKLFKRGIKELGKISKECDFKLSFNKNVSSSTDSFNKLNKIPEEGLSPDEIIVGGIRSFFNKIPLWRSSKNQYNICAPTNIVSVALSNLAQEYNIHNINTDFSGDGLLAEKVISDMMADLVGLSNKKVKALFSFGGTASNLYAMKLALNKAIPQIGKTGIPQNVYMLITEDSHFSHKTAADWLGIGVDKLIIVKSGEDGRSSLEDAEEKLNRILESGGIVAGFNINGGPFYNLAIDDVKKFLNLRSKLVKKYNLSYTPHLHVDSVIGWIWLMYRDYDFKKNNLCLDKKTLSTIKKQTARAKQIKYADSWGVDFHKGIGGAPTPAGLFVSNNSDDLILLSKRHRGICHTHHLGGYWSSENPSDITLETSRSAAPALAALGSFLSLGKRGFRILLANQIRLTLYLRKVISNNSKFMSANDESLGFNTMVIFAPKMVFGNKKRSWSNLRKIIEEDENQVDYLNKTLKSFFQWCLKNEPLGCSFSESFYKTGSGRQLSGLKYCLVSPNLDKKAIDCEVNKLNVRFKKFLNEQ